MLAFLCVLLCLREGDAHGLQLQGWSRSPAGMAEELVNPLEDAALFLSLPCNGCYCSLEEDLGCVDG